MLDLRTQLKHQEVLMSSGKVEMQLFNERVRSIIKSHLASVLDKDTLRRCQAFIHRVRESRSS